MESSLNQESCSCLACFTGELPFTVGLGKEKQDPSVVTVHGHCETPALTLCWHFMSVTAEKSAPVPFCCKEGNLMQKVRFAAETGKVLNYHSKYF